MLHHYRGRCLAKSRKPGTKRGLCFLCASGAATLRASCVRLGQDLLAPFRRPELVSCAEEPSIPSLLQARSRVSRLRSAFLFVTLGASCFCGALPANAQGVAEASRQEKARKAARPRHPGHVYTNDDLKRAQILTPEDRAKATARRQDPPAPAMIPPAQFFDAANSSPREPLAETARRYRRQKELRQAEQALRTQPSLPLRMDIPQPLAAPLPAKPSPAAMRPVAPSRPTLPIRPARRDPFARLPIVPEPKGIIPNPPPIVSAPRALPVAPRPLPVNPAARPAAPAMVSRPGSLTVQPGDSLWKLARRYFGRGARWTDFLTANAGLKNPARLRPGTILLIPSVAAFSPPSVSAGFAVRSGDSLWKIAKEQFGRGSAWTCLARANPDLRDTDRLFPGQTLVIPASCGTIP